MALTSFRVGPSRGLELAECASVPNLMVICGPNGSGKSTLLSLIRSGAGARDLDEGTLLLYQPPHRAIRRQSVQRRWLGGGAQSFQTLLQQDQVSGFEGLQINYPSRAPDNVDESGSAIKYILGKLENRRQSFLARKVDKAHRAGEETIEIASMRNVYEPLSLLVERLLPHLRFEHVDFTNEDSIKCTFVRTRDDGAETELDLDDLSSGEKSVILLFLPLVEGEMEDRLNELSSDQIAAQTAPSSRVFLLDEPELHLHPDLQRRMIAFMRERSASGDVQFIMVTHSPTILDEASDEELFILRRATTPDSNQLRRVASAGERLDALRELTGESYFVATGRNIVCLEGEPKREGAEGASDLSIVEVLNARASRYTFLAMGSRSQVTGAVGRLRAGLPAAEYGVAVAGLVDADRTTVDKDQGVVSWPVCEFENLLLAPEVVLASVQELVPESELSLADIEHHIAGIVAGRREEEIRLRVGADLGPVMIRPSGTTPQEIRRSLDAGLEDVASKLDDARLEQAVLVATSSVDEIISSDTQHHRYKGKAMLRALFKELNLSQVSYKQFCYAAARHASTHPATRAIVEATFAALDEIVDHELEATILGTTSPDPTTEITASESGSPAAQTPS